MPRRRKRPFDDSDILLVNTTLNGSGALEPVVRLWVLRLLVKLQAHQAFIRPHGFQNDELARLLGLLPEETVDDELDEDERFRPALALAELRRQHARAEAAARDAMVCPTLAGNVQRLAQKVGLSDIECRILEFTVLLNAERALDETADFLGSLTSTRVCRLLAVVLDLAEADIAAALSSRGALGRCGLVALDTNNFSLPLRSKLQLLSTQFGERMLSEEQDPLQLIRDTVFLSRPGMLAPDNYPHVQRELDILLPYLRQGLAAGDASARAGINVLVYGPAGTGKSELARMVAREMGCDLFEVASEDEDGDPVRGDQRLRAYRAALSLLSHHRALLLFDEVEDVFNDGDGHFGRRSTAQLRKAWLNRALEENPVPTFWLTNTIAGMDAAFLRRFDVIMELGVPPRGERERIVRQHAGGLLDEAAIRAVAGAEALSPAVITRAAGVIDAIRGELDLAQRSAAMQLLVSNTLTAQGHGPLRASASELPDWYDPAFVNADADLAQLAESLRTVRGARLCLWGPPGTGKSAFGHWLARQLDRPLLLKRASDLMSKWLGETEQNMARAFREAQESGAILLLDEVDSFLQDRRGARHSWEVTSVNEMLTQMENFDGLFIASTNLMDNLDQAALRRFDLKLRFGYLREAQAWQLLRRQCEALGLPVPGEAEAQELARIGVLTPGDFAVVARQHRFRQFASAAELVAVLKDECALKEDGRRAPIGFL